MSATIAAFALWLTHFRKARIEVTLGPEVHFYHPRDGGSAVYVPFIFTNISPRRATVRQVFLEITTLSGEHRLMRWMREATIAPQSWEYSYKDRVKPISIDSFSSDSRVYWFLWPENPQDDLRFIDGRYSLEAHVWLSKGSTPDVSSIQTITISKESEDELVKRRRLQDPQTRIHYFDTQTLIATTGPAKQMWRERRATPP